MHSASAGGNQGIGTNEGLIEVARKAVETNDPDREAVVLESGYDAVSVYIVRETEVVTLGTLAFVTLT
jgi:hypothetical protein